MKAYLGSIYILMVAALLMVSCSNNEPAGYETPDSGDNTALTEADFDELLKGGGERADVVAFMPAGDVGGGVLVPGTFFPPTGKGISRLEREEDELEYKIRTTGLPPGAYTNWWVIFNNPENCTNGDCDFDDLFNNPAVNSSVFWATGGIVKENGKGKFNAEIEVGELPSEPGQFLFGPGLLNPETAEVWVIVKYHGPPSDDPQELYLQTHTLLGSCDQGANAFLDPGFGVQCFDPQIVFHKAGQ